MILVAVCTVAGASIGAWAPYAVFRLAVPLDTAAHPACPHCAAPPLTSWRGWLRFGGRCPACHRPLTASRWAYVAVTASTFAALAWRLPTRSLADMLLLAAWLTLTAFGVVLAGIDIRVHRLPRPILAAAAAILTPLIALAGASAADRGLPVPAMVTAAAFGGAYLILALIGPGLVGMGDVYLAALFGLLVGTGPAPSILGAALAPYLVGLPIAAVRLARGRITRRSQVAFGPYLIAGAILSKVLLT